MEIYFILIKKVANVDIVSKYVEPTILVKNHLFEFILKAWPAYLRFLLRESSEKKVKNIYLFLTSVEKVQPKKQRPVT